MSRKLAALVLVAATISLASGCGGGGMVGTPPRVNTSLVIKLSSVPTVAAEKIGDGAWTAASPQGGTLTLSLPPGVNSYGIALLCSQPNGNVSISLEWIIEATTADNIDKVPGCLGSLPTTASISGSVDASAISGVAAVEVEAPGGHEIL